METEGRQLEKGKTKQASEKEGCLNNLDTRVGKTQTMKNTELPTSILVRAIPCDVILTLDDISARHAAACLSLIVVIIVVIVTTVTMTPEIPTPYTKTSR